MWALNQLASATLGAAARPNLMIDDPGVLSLILNNIAAVDTTRFTRKSCTVSARITNTSTGPITLHHYRVMTRKEQTISLDTTLQTGFTDSQAGFGTVTPCIFSGLGVTPYMNPRFTSQFKILSVKRRDLRPAQVWKIAYKNTKPKHYNRQSIAPNSVAYKACRGNIFSVFVMRGNYGYNAIANAGYQHGITDASVAIQYENKYTFSWVKDESMATGSSVSSAALPTTTTMGAAGSAHIPTPIVIVHPDSSVGVAGARAYATTDCMMIEQHNFNVN
jgi:hypothetical protein